MSFIVQEIPAPTVFGIGQATAVAAGNVIDYYIGEQDLLILTSEASSNWTVNLEFDPTLSLNVAMNDGDVAKFSLGVTNGSPAYVQTGFTIDGNPSGISFTWASGAPTVGFTSAINFYDFEVLKIANETYDVRASLTKNTTFKTIPDAPPAPLASALSGTEVRVTVSDPTNTGGLTISNYLVSSSTGISQASAASPIVITGLTSGVPVSFTARVQNAIGISNQSSASNTVTPVTPRGEEIFGLGGTAGTYTFIPAAGVTSVSVVAVGPGGVRRAGVDSDIGGSGGALAYKNNISVTPGSSYTVVVGVAMASSPYTHTGSSFTAGFGTMTAGPGNRFPNTGGVPSGTYDGGGNGGAAGNYPGGAGAGGGGGAGGYAGNGGRGGDGGATTPTAGSGGGGGGGGGGVSFQAGGGAGGGVGLFGQGSNGAAGVNGVNFTFGGGGSGAITGPNSLYGAGWSGSFSYPGSGGGVRVIWMGNTRQFPSTDVGTP